MNILVVDDEETNSSLIKIIIQRVLNNISCFEANSAIDAITILNDCHIDLILCDIQMPYMDGFELVEYIRNVEKTKNIPVIFISGVSYDYNLEKKLERLKIFKFLQKPISYEILKHTISDIKNNINTIES